MFTWLRRNKNKRQGAALAEYAVLLAGILIVALAGVAVLGHKISDLIGISASVLPGAHAEDNAPIQSGKLVETTQNADGNIVIDTTTIAASTSSRLGTNLGVTVTNLVVEP